MAGKIVNELQTLGGGVVSNSVLVPCSEDGQVLKKATVENINAVTPTKPLKLYAHDGTYGFIDSPYFSDSDDQQIRFFTNNGRGIYLSNLNDDKPQYWDGTNGYPMVYLKESWVSGASWYRLYSDNWLEQGTIPTGTSGTWTFSKPFSNTNYQVQFSIYRTTISSAGWNNHMLYNTKTTTNIGYTNPDSSQCMLYACGYAA